MRTKKVLSAVIAMTVTATAMLGTAAMQASAADQNILTFDLRSNGKNEIKISADQIADGDITVPVDIFIPDNPGVSGINLKLQVNDGQVDEAGKFGNYGFYLNDGEFSAPFCFDSANKGDAAGSFAKIFNCKDMNVSWLFSDKTGTNADAAVQAGTTAWDASASWAYTNPFVTTNLVIPKGTPAGTYQFDVRKDQYVNAKALENGLTVYSKSSCFGATTESTMDFRSVPLTVTVQAETQWEDTYEIANAGHYYIVGDVCGKPGEIVEVPIYIFGDTGTAGAQIYLDFDTSLTLDEFTDSKDKRAYRLGSPLYKTESRPVTFTFAKAQNMVAENGSILQIMNIEIPANAKDGDIYDIKFYEGSGYTLKIVDMDGEKLPVSFYNGSITVSSDSSTKLNRTAVSLTDIGQTTNLTLFNATGSVTWTSSDPAVATVDQNGFVKTVGKGTAVITASNNGTNYTATVKVGGLFGDVNQNGEIGSDDAQLVLTHYTETMAGNTSSLSAAQIAIAEITGDGITDISDAQLILKYYVDKVVSGLAGTNWRDVTGNPNAPADY